MKRPARVPAKLSASVHQQLNQYALAASVAGVAALALAMPAEAKIIYTPAHHYFHLGDRKGGRPYYLDLNHDGIMDFILFVNTCRSSQCTGTSKFFGIFGNSNGGNTPNAIEVSPTASPFFGSALALKEGSKIPSYRPTLREFAYFVEIYSGHFQGNWKNVKNRYVGLAFWTNGQKHYGWARLSAHAHKHPAAVTGILTGYAYETIPNKPIIAGKTQGKDVITVQPASLGHLAAGASAIPAWRPGK